MSAGGSGRATRSAHPRATRWAARSWRTGHSRWSTRLRATGRRSTGLRATGRRSSGRRSTGRRSTRPSTAVHHGPGACGGHGLKHRAPRLLSCGHHVFPFVRGQEGVDLLHGRAAVERSRRNLRRDRRNARRMGGRQGSIGGRPGLSVDFFHHRSQLGRRARRRRLRKGNQRQNETYAEGSDCQRFSHGRRLAGNSQACLRIASARSLRVRALRVPNPRRRVRFPCARDRVRAVM
jgi:hypothetical protein